MESNFSEDANWFVQILGNLWDMVSSYIPWWVWPLVVVALVLVLVVRTQAGRTILKRWCMGHPLDGVPTTNARMWRRATRTLEEFSDTRPSPWHYKAFALRALVRHGITLWVLALVVGLTASAWVIFAGAVAVPMLVGLVRWRVEFWQATKTGSRWVAEHRPHLPTRPARHRGRILAEGDAARLALEAAPGEEDAGPGEAVAVREAAPSGAGGPAPASAQAQAQAAPAEEEDTDEDPEQSNVRTPRDMEKEILRPLWDGVRPALEVSEHDNHKPKKYIVLPPSVDVDDAPVTINLPREWQGHADQKAKLDHAVKTRLPGEWSAAYKLHGSQHTATYKKVPRPPKKVDIRDVMHMVKKGDPMAPVFALGPRGSAVTADLVADSPHIAVSMGSGAGKSTTVRAILAPMLHHGAEVHILDIKRTSHRWAKGLPNVRIYKEPEDIHDALVYLGERAKARHKEEDENPDVEFSPMVVVAEEMNILADELEDYWEECKKQDKDLPKNSPAFKGLSQISYGGRSASSFLIVIAQKLDARLFGSRGGGAVRENFALRLLARFTPQAWKQLADIKPMAKLPKILGRTAVVVQGEWTEVQVIYWPTEIAREYALSGRITPASQVPVTAEVVEEVDHVTSDVSQEELSQDWVRDAGPTHTVSPDQSADEGPGARVVSLHERMHPAPWETGEDEDDRVLVSFKQAYDRGMFDGASYENARQIYNREKKKGLAPDPVQESPKRWDLDALAEWWDDRKKEKQESG